MSNEEKTDFTTSYFHCIDSVENFKIKVILKPFKNLIFPLPQFDVETSSPDISSSHEKQLDIEEYTFQWQEKIFSQNEIKKYFNEPDWKNKINEKYHDSYLNSLNNLNNYPKKLFSYVEFDNYSANQKNLIIFENDIEKKKCMDISSLNNKFNNLNISGHYTQDFKNISKKKIINFYPSQDFKNKNRTIIKNVERMFIMVDLGSKIDDTKKKEKEKRHEYILCALTYNYANNVLEMTPSFSKKKHTPYIISIDCNGTKNSYFYWLHHASLDIPSEILAKEIKIMYKVIHHQDELRKMQIESNFFQGEPSHIYFTLIGEIVSAEDFEYDQLYVHYFITLPFGWKYKDINSANGATQTSYKNYHGVCYFSHLFEMNFFVELKSLQEAPTTFPELFFEVLSVDKYNRFRNEGYTYIDLPKKSGMYKYNLNCWRATDKTINSMLKRFFIGGGPELENISYVGLSKTEKTEVINRFGFETIPSGKILVNISVLQQSEIFKVKKRDLIKTEKNIFNRLDTNSLLGSVDTVLEDFRRAKEKMLKAKEGLEMDTTNFAIKLD